MSGSPYREYWEQCDANYEWWGNARDLDKAGRVLTMPVPGSTWGNALPQTSEMRRNFTLPMTEGYDTMSWEERISRLYTLNCYLGLDFHPSAPGAPVGTYVNSGLDGFPRMSSNDAYIDFALSRARQLFTNPKSFSPEEFSELRRIGDKISLFHKYADYDAFMNVGGLGRALVELSWIDRARGKYMHKLNEEPQIADRIQDNDQLHWNVEYYASRFTPLSMKIRAFAVDAATLLTDWLFFYYWRTYFRNSLFSRISTRYDDQFNLPDWNSLAQSGTGGGCGMSSSLDPMREDPGAFILDLDVYILSLGFMSDFGKSAQLAWFFSVAPEFLKLFIFGGAESNRVVLGLSVIIWFAVFFTLISASVGVVSAKTEPSQYILLLELIGLCVSTIFAAVSLFWYDPAGQAVALVVVVISSCEFVVLASQLFVLKKSGTAPRGEYMSAGYCAVLFSVGSFYSWIVDAVISTGIVPLAVKWFPAIVTIGSQVVVYLVPAVGLFLFTSTAFVNWYAALFLRTPYPLYGERYGFDKFPLSKLATEDLHKYIVSLAKQRAVFPVSVGDTSGFIGAAVAAHQKPSSIDVFVLAEYGAIPSVVCGVIFTALLWFALLLTIFSSKVKWADFRDAVVSYECGSEQFDTRATAISGMAFFRLMVVFLIFELELLVLFLVFPMITILNPASVVAVTFFILFIQIATLIEIRSGAVRWIRSAALFLWLVVDVSSDCFCSLHV